MSGVEKDELINPEMGFDFALIKIPLSELPIFGTFAGTKDNNPFTSEAIDFLKSKNIEFIIGLGENKNPILSSAAINISLEEATDFLEIISINKGSLRPEKSKVNGWSIFETE